MPISQRDLGWAAGFIEGEGYFDKNYGSPAIVVGQVQREPLERLVRLFGGSITTGNKLRGHQQATLKWRRGGPSGRGIMMTMYGLMSPRRRQQIKSVLDAWRARPVDRQYRSHCPRGHPYSGDNLEWQKKKNPHRRIQGCRMCRTCRLEAVARYAIVRSARGKEQRAHRRSA